MDIQSNRINSKSLGLEVLFEFSVVQIIGRTMIIFSFSQSNLCFVSVKETHPKHSFYRLLLK